MSDQSLARELPNSREAERCILGAGLLDNTAFDAETKGLRSTDFFHAMHRRIFECMSSLREKKQPVDLIILIEELDRAGQLEAAGGPPYISQLSDCIPRRSSNLPHYVGIVKDRADRRAAIHAAEL